MDNEKVAIALIGIGAMLALSFGIDAIPIEVLVAIGVIFCCITIAAFLS